MILTVPELSSIHYLLLYLFIALNMFYLNVFFNLILQLFPSYIIFSFIIIGHSETYSQ